MFGISERENYLFWLPRAYMALELPSFWHIVKSSIDEGISYVNTLEKVEIKVHPSFKYIEYLIKLVRSKKEKAIKDYIWNKNPYENESNEVFVDCLLREYKVNMTEMLVNIRKVEIRLQENTEEEPTTVNNINKNPLKRMSSSKNIKYFNE